MSAVEKFRNWLDNVTRQEAETAKRAGVRVTRPVLNAEEWAAWAAKAGVPSPVAAADMHVTVIYSSVDVKMKPCMDYRIAPTCNAVFCMMGANEDAFTVAFYDWCLSDRHWAYLNAGAVSSWPTYRPHLTLSYDAKGFEIADEMLASAPEYIVLGPEVAGPVKADAPADEQDPEGVEAEDDDEGVIVVIEIAMSAAEKVLESKTLDAIDRTALYDISKGRPVSVGVAKRLRDVAPDVVTALGGTKGTIATRPVLKRRVEHDVELKMTAPMRDAVRKSGVSEVIKTMDEQRLLYAISNVYSIGGETVKDSDGDGFSTRAMEEFIAEVLKHEKSGSFEHSPDLRNIVVQGLVLSDEVQKALGIDLGYEALVTATHFPDEADWAKVKEGDWEQSIKGRFWFYEDD